MTWACLWTIVGATLQTSAQNADWMFCGKLSLSKATSGAYMHSTSLHWNGNWCAQCDHPGLGNRDCVAHIARSICRHGVHSEYLRRRCSILDRIVSLKFLLLLRSNGTSGTSFYGDGTSSFIWRFPISFQIVPLIGLFGILWLMPESPRWLVKVGRDEEARWLLGRLRGEGGEDLGKAEAEFQDIRNNCELERKTAKEQSYFAMFFGIGSGDLHTGRRVQLVIWLQILQEWVGIAGITIYGPQIFTIAGIGNKDRLWVSGLNNITYMVGLRSPLYFPSDLHSLRLSSVFSRSIE